MNNKVINTPIAGIKSYQHGCVNKFIWIYHLFFVSLRAGWVAEYYYDRESGESWLRFQLNFV